MISDIVTITKRQEAKLLAAVSNQLVTLFDTPGSQQEFDDLLEAQRLLSRLFGMPAENVDKVLQKLLTTPYEPPRTTQPPDAPSDPNDLAKSSGFGEYLYRSATNPKGGCDCGDVDCCDGEEEVDEHEDILNRLSGLESEHTRTIERMNRLHERLDTVRDLQSTRTDALRDRTDVIQREVQHWHQRVTDLHNQIQQLKTFLIDSD